MEITYFGHQCVEIKQKGITALLDPYEPTGEIAHPRPKAHLVTMSSLLPAEAKSKEIPGASDTGEAFVVKHPGGYEVKGILIDGIASFADGEKGALRGPNTIFSLQWSGMNIVHCGKLGHQLTADEIEELGNVDVACVPVGYGMDAKTAAVVVDQIEPRLIIPMAENDLVLSEFIKEVGATREDLDILKFEAKDLPNDGQRLVVLKAQ